MNGQDRIPARIARLQGILACENLMAKHTYYRSGGMHREELEESWSRSPDISLTIQNQVFTGREEVFLHYVLDAEAHARAVREELAKLYPEVQEAPDFRTLPVYANHFTTSPIVEVAEDGQTARGFFYTNGFAANWVTTDGRLHEKAVNGRFGADFVLEDGAWKIRHLRFCMDLTGSIRGGGFAPVFDRERDAMPGAFPGGAPASEPFSAWAPVQTPQRIPPMP